MAKQVQFLRNSALFNNALAARNALDAFVTGTGTTAVDGAIYLARYGSSDTNAKTIIGIAHVGAGGKTMTKIEATEDIALDITDLQSRMTAAEGKITTLTGQVGTISNQITVINGNIGTINENIEGINGDITRIDGELETITSDIDGVSGNLSSLTQRVTTVETKANQNSEDIETIETDLASLTQKVTANTIKAGNNSVVVASAATGTSISVKISTATTNTLKLDPTNGLYVNQVSYTGDNKTIGMSGSTSSKVFYSTISLVELEESGTTPGFLKSYQLQDSAGTPIGDTINIPKDLVVKSGSVEEVTSADTPYSGAKVGDKYIKLVISNNESTPIYIPVKELVDVYSGINGVTVNGSNQISIQIDTAATDKYLAVAAKGLKITGLTDDLTSIAESAGLNSTTFAYEPITANTYISGATSLKNADVLITNAITTLNTKVNGLDGANLYLSGYTKGSDSSAVVSGDTINEAFGKVEVKIGNLTSQVNGLDGANLYLSGYTLGSVSTPVASGDTINAAFGKVQNQINSVSGTAGSAIKSVSGSGAISASTNASKAVTISLKIDSGSTSILTNTANGLGISENAVWDCGTYTVG